LKLRKVGLPKKTIIYAEEIFNAVTKAEGELLKATLLGINTSA
jgi:hypothetical protein